MITESRTQRQGRKGVSSLLVLLAGLVVALTLGYLLKAQCLTHEWDGFQYRSSCYNDIYSLAEFRGINDGATPYIDGNGLDDGKDGDLEYPVGTGLIIWLAGLLSSNGPGFFYVSALILAFCGVMMGLLLINLARDRWRLWLVFASPPLILYAFHNWDLFAGLLVVAALYSWHNGRPNATAVWLGLGAATKVYPGLLLPAFLLAEGRRTGKVPWGMLSWSAGSFALMNLPVMVANLPGWLYPWRFQSSRLPNFETHWFFLRRHLGDGSAFWDSTYASLTSVLSAIIFLVGLVILIRRENRRERLRPVALSFAILVLWLLTAKVYSPQFSLWLLPFFALVSVRKRLWIGFVVTDAMVWAAISFFFLGPDQGSVGSELRLWIVEVSTMLRYALLIWLLREVDRSEDRLFPATRERVMDQPVNELTSDPV